MTFTYTGDPSSSPVEEIRFYLGDTDEDNALLSDEEIEFYIAKLDKVYGNLVATASYLADVIANRFATEISISADGVSIGANELQDRYAAMAKSLRAQWHAISGAGGVPDVGGILVGEELSPLVKPFEFGIGMHDNDRAGQQEYGGVWNRAYGDY